MQVVIHFVVADLMLAPNQTICVSGSLPELGNWMQDQGLELKGGLAPHEDLPGLHQTMKVIGIAV